MTATTAPHRSPNKSAAAYDLIRNLDAALLSAQHSSASAKQDAERARRNARAAAEVARRYGRKGSTSTNINSSKSNSSNSSNNGGGGGERTLLEMKRERRSRARMAAEARSRREYELNSLNENHATFSPRGDPNDTATWRSTTTINTAVDGKSVDGDNRGMIMSGGDNSKESRYTYDNQSPVHPVNLDKLVVLDSDKENEVVAVDVVKENLTAAPPQVVNEEDHNNAQHDVIPRGMSNETMSATDGTVSTMDFEDALEDHSVNHHHDNIRHYDNQEGGEMMQQQQQGRDDYYNQGHPNNEENAINAYHDGQQYYQHNEQGGNNEYHHNHQQENQHYHLQSEQTNYYHQDNVNAASSQQQQQYYSTMATPTHGNKSVPSNPTTPKAGTTTATTTTATTNHHTTLESSNAEDVLTLSLELERVRTQLATTTQHLSTSQSHISTLQSHNAHLQSELHRLHSELEEERERNSNTVSSLQSKLHDENTRANAAEEDASIALELAKDATNAKEECEEYLNRSVEEIDAWKGRCEGLERELLNCQQQQMLNNDNQVEEEEDVKKVRFADESESGGVPPPPPTTPSAKPWTSTPITTPQTTPNKSSIASGRAYLYRHSPKKSPYKEQVQDLLKRTAKTRRLLKEQIMSSPSSKQLPSSLALVTTSTTTMNITNAPSSLPREGNKLSLNEDGFASRQGAACRSVGKMIRDSGCRLKLNGKWFDNNTAASSSNTTNSNNNDNNEGQQHQQSSLVIEGVAELECMVKEYCSTVEGTIGNQDKRIEELLAFCDHLEKELVN